MIIIPAQSGTYRHLQRRVTDLIAESGLTNVVDILTVQLVADADGPHQGRVPLDEFIPRPLLTVTRAGNQGNDRWVVAHGASFPRPAGPRTCWLLPRSLVSRAAVPHQRGGSSPPLDTPRYRWILSL